MFSSIGPAEMLIVLVLALLVLGPKRLPEAGRGIGRGMREFKDAITSRDAEPEPDQLAGRGMSNNASTTA